MVLLLKDCGLDGFKGSVQRCDECERSTVHFRRPGGWPVCGVCGAIALPRAELPALGAPMPRRADVFALASASQGLRPAPR